MYMDKLDRIITEAIDNFLKEEAEWAEVHGSVGQPYSPEQARINKAAIGRVGNRSYDDAPKANTAVRGNFSYPSVQEWKAKYPNMSYGEYCEKIYGVKKR